MSSIYRYVVFAIGKQPSVDEVSQLREWAVVSKSRFAIGVNSDDGALTLAFDARDFESAVSGGTPLATLLSRWAVRGCMVRERLAFIKQPTALQPIPGGMLHEAVEHRSDPTLKRKQLAAQEALGLAGLKLQQKLQQHAWLQGVARVVPYALIGLAGLLTIVVGVNIGTRLLESPVERRQETIKRVANDAMGESLAVPASQPSSTADTTPVP